MDAITSTKASRAVSVSIYREPLCITKTDVTSNSYIVEAYIKRPLVAVNWNLKLLQWC